MFYLCASDETLKLSEAKIKKDYPKIKVANYSPPFKEAFSDKENKDMITLINEFKPTILFVGMTAPKQEKWVDKNRETIDAKIISIGAVFDFYAGTVKRAQAWMIHSGFEWLYRLIKEPKRMWKRHLISNTKFLHYMLSEKVTKN